MSVSFKNRVLHSLTALTLLLSSYAHSGSEPHNVILIIGDGMDDQQITIARNYLVGAEGKLLLDDMPLRSAVRVLTVDEQQPKLPVYVADSANSATALASGVTTSRGRIASMASTNVAIETLVEQAQEAGLATGIVTTASITDATPASFIAHVAVRGCENPEKMHGAKYMPAEACAADLIANGGLGSIAEQIALGKTDVLLGGGLEHFQFPAEGVNDSSLLDVAADNGYTIITEAEQLQSSALQGPVLGLFADSHLPVALQGEGGRIAEKPTPSLLNKLYSGLGEVELPVTMQCEANPDFESVPTLQAMTDSALSLLSEKSKHSGNGFFLMVESASIDKQSHYRNPCGSIGELQQLEETLSSVMAFAQQYPNTLILVTADHGQAAQLISAPSMFENEWIAVYTPGYVARLITPEGQVMGVNYATNDYFIEEHTGVNVPLFSNNAGVGRVGSSMTQPQIYQIMKDYLFQ